MPPQKKPSAKKPVVPKKSAAKKEPAKAKAKPVVKASAKPAAKTPAKAKVASKAAKAPVAPAKKSVVKQPAARAKVSAAKASPASAPSASYAEAPQLTPGWVASPKQTFEKSDIIKLTFAYLWRSWLLAFTWGMLASTVGLAVLVYKLPYQSDAWLMAGQGVDIAMSFLLSLVAFAWVQSQPRLLGGVRLASSLTKGARWWQVVVLWFSFTWRSVLWVLAGIVVLVLIKALSTVIAPTFPFISGVLLWGGIGVGLVYFLLLVPYLVWRQLLKRQTFSWGKLELLRVKS